MKREELAATNSPGSSDEHSSPGSPMSNNSDGEEMRPARNGQPRSDCGAIIGLSDLNRYEKYNGDVDRRTSRKHLRKSSRPLKNRQMVEALVVDTSFWEKIKTCCGYEYENKSVGALLIDARETNEWCPNHSQPSRISKFYKNTIKNGTVVQSTGTEDKLVVHVQEYSNGTPTQSPLPSPLPQPTAMKKHHFSAKRHAIGTIDSELLPSKKTNLVPVPATSSVKASELNQVTVITSTNGSNGTTKTQKTSASKLQSADTTSARSYNHLPKIKSDSGKVVKHSLDRIVPTKAKVSDLSGVKNLVKLCTDIKASNLGGKKLGATAGKGLASSGVITSTTSMAKFALIGNENKIIEALTGNKFSDNSSDSGYEETLHDTAQVRFRR